MQTGVSGWVMNCQDGQVYMEIEGPLSACVQMMLWVERGPELAWVERLEIAQLSLCKKKGFEIKKEI
jgi:acylphosphatase